MGRTVSCCLCNKVVSIYRVVWPGHQPRFLGFKCALLTRLSTFFARPSLTVFFLSFLFFFFFFAFLRTARGFVFIITDHLFCFSIVSPLLFLLLLLLFFLLRQASLDRFHAVSRSRLNDLQNFGRAPFSALISIVIDCNSLFTIIHCSGCCVVPIPGWALG